MSSVSVAMATYNGEPHIHEQLLSLANQSLAPVELVVTDDCSGDRTLDVVREFARTAPFPVRIYENEIRLGYRANFMRAASLCTSDLISFCDHDDIWDRRKIETCTECFQDPKVLLAYHNAVVIDAKGRELGTLDWRAAPRSLNPPMSINPWLIGPGFTQVFRRSLPAFLELWSDSKDHFACGEPMAHDQWFFFLAATLGSIAYLSAPLALYRQHGGNLCGWNGASAGSRFERYFTARGADDSVPLERACRRRAEILDAAQPELEGVWRERAAEAAMRYRQLEQKYAARRTLYTSPQIGRRLKSFREILSLGGYGDDDVWKFTRKSLAKDVSVGILFGHRLKRTPEALEEFA